MRSLSPWKTATRTVHGEGKILHPYLEQGDEPRDTFNEYFGRAEIEGVFNKTKTYLNLSLSRNGQ